MFDLFIKRKNKFSTSSVVGLTDERIKEIHRESEERDASYGELAGFEELLALCNSDKVINISVTGMLTEADRVTLTLYICLVEDQAEEWQVSAKYFRSFNIKNGYSKAVSFSSLDDRTSQLNIGSTYVVATSGFVAKRLKTWDLTDYCI